jgi:hypothetical protein
MFDHEDGICARGSRRASHDLHAFSNAYGVRGGLAGAHFADDVQAAWKVGGSNGKAVPRGTRERWIRAVGYGIFGQDTAESILQSDGVPLCGHGAFTQLLPHAFTSLFPAQCRHCRSF